MKKRLKRKKKHNVFQWGERLVCLLLLCAILMALQNKDQTQGFFGHYFFYVKTNSMATSDAKTRGIVAGDIVVVKEQGFEALQIDDVVTFQVGENAYLTHRLQEKMKKPEGNYMITKGDANQSEDPPVSEERIVGKVMCVVPKMGMVFQFMKDNLFFFCGMLFVVIGFSFTKSGRKKPPKKSVKRKRKLSGARY